MILMKLRGTVLLFAAVLTLGGCAAGTAAPGTLSVVAGLYPYAYLAQAIGGDRVTVTNLTTPGAEPHDLELTARQIATVATADLVIAESHLQPAVDAAIATTAPARVLDVATVLPLEERDHGADPHVWLDPVRMATLAEAVARELAAIDPDHRSTYAANLATLLDVLTGIDQAYSSGLATCRRTAFITTHAAFGYLADRYGLTQIAIAGISPDTDPSPARIAEIQQAAADQGLTTVFFETLASPALAQAIAGDLGLVTDQLDPIEGITAESRADSYPGLMAANLQALRQANGCS